MVQGNSADVISEIGKCKECLSCEEVCSIFLTVGDFGPYKKLLTVKEILFADVKPKTWETVFLCTKCEACDSVCPESIPITRIIDIGRKACVEKWGLQYPRQAKITENIFRVGNPFGKETSRNGWLKGNLNTESKTLLHLGCMLSYPLREMGQNIVNILTKLNVDFTIAPDERCCGYFIYNTGNHAAAGQLIAQNEEEFQRYDQIICACAGCYTFLKEHYNLQIGIKHVIETIFESWGDKDNNHNLEMSSAVFQDSCHIARPHGITATPRRLLEKIGIRLFEFKKALCCGANGGMRIINPELAQEIGKSRLLAAKQQSDTLLTLCPFCIHNFREAAHNFNIDIQIGDIFGVLDKLLP